MYLFILQFMFLEFNVEHPQVMRCLQIRNTVMIAYRTLYKKTHIATNITLKEGYIIGLNYLNGANMTLWVKYLQYSDTQKWLDMIPYHKSCYPYGLFMPSTSIKTYQNVV